LSASLLLESTSTSSTSSLLFCTSLSFDKFVSSSLFACEGSVFLYFCSFIVLIFYIFSFFLFFLICFLQIYISIWIHFFNNLYFMFYYLYTCFYTPIYMPV